ncbi:glycosyl hydrolase [Streptomyces sp. NPDC092296]|uniref:glycosyl hydrolase n=1 Tax=Streptomyces sp. NPDC092296 TaxID=3366012 RepID=UPI003800ED3E
MPAHRSRFRRKAAALALGLLAPLAAVPAAQSAQAATAAVATPPAAARQVYEAEDGVLQGVTVASDAPGYTGTGYVDGFDESGDQVTITVPDSPGGLYDLSLRYRAPYGDKKTTLLLNGAGAGEVSLSGTEQFADAPAGKVLLKAGRNTITVQNDWGWYQVDSISLAPVQPRAAHQVTGDLVDPQATPEARSLMRYLADHYGKDLLSGQQDMDSVQWLQDHVGRAPAIAGLDMMDYSPSRVERGTASQEVEHALDWDRQGGITAFVWHWNAPSHLVDQPGEEWWRGFYTDATTFDLAAALADPSSEDYRLLLRDIDAISAQLSRLQDAQVPVLWRPLHEAEGGWFWWGAKGPGPAKQLYRLMYDRMVNHNHLHNLIWVWNSVSPDWYPGDDVVDVVSADSYPPAGDHGPVSATYDQLLSLGHDGKLAALAEVGSIPDPELTRAYQADWSWFTTWSGDFLTDGNSNSLDFLKRVYDDSRVITLDELGDFKHDGGCTAAYDVLSSWKDGYLVRVTVRNSGTKPINGWRVGWNAPADQRVTEFWNADLKISGTARTATDLHWNGALKPGEQADFYLIGGTPPTAPTTPAPSCAAN